MAYQAFARIILKGSDILKKSIKLTAVILSLVMIFALFCACSRKNADGGTTAGPTTGLTDTTLPAASSDEETKKNDGIITDVSEEGSNGAAGELASDIGEIASDIADGVSEGISNAAER